MRHEGELWTAVAERVELVELPGVDEDEIELTVVDGERTLKLDGEPTIRPLPALDALAEEHGDVAVHAERVDGHLFAADVSPL
jgi:HSP20 family molecular chaperone IbpA